MSMKSFKDRRIVVTGLGTINPIAYNVPEFWENLVKGKNGIRTIQNFDYKDSPVHIGGEVDYPENIDQFVPKKMIRRLERFIIFGMIAGRQAFTDSGISKEMVDAAPDRFGIIIGTGDAGNDGHYKMARKIDESGMENVSPFYVVGVIPNTPSGFLGKELNFQGPNFSVNSACATSNHAFGTAAMMIKMGMADVMIAGGTESVLNEAGLAGFGAIYALSRRNDSPETASRPFDKDRNGFILAEGAGCLCLEDLEHAKKRGAKIYAELRGFGFSCDAYDLVAPHPEGTGAARAVSTALEDAGMNLDEIDLINAHGTSTPLGDVTESNMINRVFGHRGNKVPVHSTKSMLGHMVGAAGSTEAIAAILAIEKGVIHPSINVFEQDPEIKLNIVANEPREQKVNAVLSNSFGFGGQNSVIILSKFNN
jgi:3-oxoacyl-[acyl-carrier-protein] synthase II